jgi:hypothetical protein
MDINELNKRRDERYKAAIERREATPEHQQIIAACKASEATGAACLACDILRRQLAEAQSIDAQLQRTIDFMCLESKATEETIINFLRVVLRATPFDGILGGIDALAKDRDTWKARAEKAEEKTASHALSESLSESLCRDQLGRARSEVEHLSTVLERTQAERDAWKARAEKVEISVASMLDDMLIFLSKHKVPTPERTYKSDGGWTLAMTDLKRCVDRLQQQAKAAEQTARRAIANSNQALGEWKKCIAERDSQTTTVERLREAGQAIVDRWDSPLWKDQPHTFVFINAMRDILAATPPQNLAAVKAAAYREAAERISTMPERMPCAFGGITHEDAMREVLMMAQDLERTANGEQASGPGKGDA